MLLKSLKSDISFINLISISENLKQYKLDSFYFLHEALYYYIKTHMYPTNILLCKVTQILAFSFYTQCRIWRCHFLVYNHSITRIIHYGLSILPLLKMYLSTANHLIIEKDICHIPLKNLGNVYLHISQCAAFFISVIKCRRNMS